MWYRSCEKYHVRIWYDMWDMSWEIKNVGNDGYVIKMVWNMACGVWNGIIWHGRYGLTWETWHGVYHVGTYGYATRAIVCNFFSHKVWPPGGLLQYADRTTLLVTRFAIVIIRCVISEITPCHYRKPYVKCSYINNHCPGGLLQYGAL
jgi:hypothetical protein